MRNWTYEKIENTSELDFAIEILKERARNYPRKFSPFVLKLQKSITFLESLSKKEK